jgi:hypothetical protein
MRRVACDPRGLRRVGPPPYEPGKASGGQGFSGCSGMPGRTARPPRTTGSRAEPARREAPADHQAQAPVLGEIWDTIF